jgi:hypothetical protein
MKIWLQQAHTWIAQAHAVKPTEGGVPAQRAWDHLPWTERLALELLHGEAKILIHSSMP